jgi:hypothetical protein
VVLLMSPVAVRQAPCSLPYGWMPPPKTPTTPAQGEAESILPSTTLSKLFEGWPRAVQGMLSAAPPESILEGGVFIRR